MRLHKYTNTHLKLKRLCRHVRILVFRRFDVFDILMFWDCVLFYFVHGKCVFCCAYVCSVFLVSSYTLSLYTCGVRGRAYLYASISVSICVCVHVRVRILKCVRLRVHTRVHSVCVHVYIVYA